MGYKELRCPYCSQMTPTSNWPSYGMRAPFYNQTREKTEREPGAHKIGVHCQKCNEDFFVVWDRDPRCHFNSLPIHGPDKLLRNLTNRMHFCLEV